MTLIIIIIIIIRVGKLKKCCFLSSIIKDLTILKEYYLFHFDPIRLYPNIQYKYYSMVFTKFLIWLYSGGTSKYQVVTRP